MFPTEHKSLSVFLFHYEKANNLADIPKNGGIITVHATLHSSVFTPSFNEKFMPTLTTGFGCILNASA